MATSNSNSTPSTQANVSDSSLNEPVFQIQRIYLKELSLEQPNSPNIFLESEQPKLDIQINIDVQALVEGVYEVSITATLQTTIKDKTVFLIEGKQAGIFEARNLDANQLEPILNVACPQIIYPYLRSNIADTVTRAGFAPVHLAEVNFHALYEEQQAELQKSLQSTPAANS